LNFLFFFLFFQNIIKINLQGGGKFNSVFFFYRGITLISQREIVSVVTSTLVARKSWVKPFSSRSCRTFPPSILTMGGPVKELLSIYLLFIPLPFISSAIVPHNFIGGIIPTLPISAKVLSFFYPK